MEYYDHGMVGATLAIAVGVQRRYGWPAVVLAALAGMVPDWDAATKHTDPVAYQRGHRFWGHNLFAVTAAGMALGRVGYLIYRSRNRYDAKSPDGKPGGAAPWILLGVGIMLSHPLLDLLYCGVDRNADWPVGLFWPVWTGGFALPWMPWTDRGATVLLSLGLIACLLVRRFRQGIAVATLLLLGVYVGIRGAILHWG